MKRMKAAAGRTVALAISAAMALTGIAPAQIFGGELIFTDSEAGAVDEGDVLFTEAPEQSAEVSYSEPVGEILFEDGAAIETEPAADAVQDEIIAAEEIPAQISPELPAAPAEELIFDAGEPAEETVPEDVILFEEETTTAEAPVQDAPVVLVDEPAEDALNQDLFSDGILTEAVGGTEGTPPQVSGINIYYAEDTDSVPDSLRWDYIQGVYTYEIEVVSDGSIYYEQRKGDGRVLADVDKGTDNDYIPYRTGVTVSASKFPSVNLSEFASLLMVTRQTSGIHTKRMAEDALGLCMKNGKTYQFRVRAVYVNDGKSTFGEWSEPVSYTVSKVMTPVELGTLTLLSKEWNDTKTGVYYTLNYSGEINGGDVLVDVSTVQSFKTVLYSGLKSQKDTSVAESPDNPEKLRIYVPASASQVGDYRYFRAHNEVDGVPVKDADGKTVYSNVISTAIPSQTVATPTPVPHETVLTWPEKLVMTDQDANTAAFQFTMNVSESEIGHWGYYVIVYDNVGDQHKYYYQFTGTIPTGNEFYSVSRTFTVNKSDFLMDKTYYVRVVPYYCDKAITAAVFADIKDEKQAVMEGSPSNVVHFAKTKKSVVKDFRMDGLRDGKYYFLYDANLYGTDEVEIWISRSNKFPSDRELTYVAITTDPEEYSIETGFSGSGFSFKPGMTYYVKARPLMVDYDYERAEYGYTYGDFTNPVSFTTQKPILSVEAQTITDNEVKFSVSSSVPEYSTGYIYERKEGSSWLVLSNTTNNILTDSGLDANTTYVYRVKSYFYDKATGKNTNSSAYAYLTVTTWGGKLNLKATQTATTKVKLDWTKVSGATGYEVYKRVSSATGTIFSAGEVQNNVNTWQQVAALASSVNTYTVTGLYGDEADLMVKAVKTVDKKTFSISESKVVDLIFAGMDLDVKATASTNGSVTASWTALYGATGYKVEKKEDTTGSWVDYKTLAATATSITLPAASETTFYRIRGYKTASGITQYTDYVTIEVSPLVKVPTGVKASVSKTEKGAINISWTAVPGADYYVVYRTTSSSFKYNKDLGTYSYVNGKTLRNYVPAVKKLSGFALEDPAYPTHVTGTTFTDRPVTYMNATNGKTIVVNEGPKGGTIYYYYVRAYKKTDRGAIISSGCSKYAKARYSKITKPATPSITKVAATAGKVTVTWKKPARAEGYFLLRSTNSKKTAASFRQIAYISSGSTLKYVDTSVKKGTTYYYKLIAFNKNEINSYLRSTDSVIKSVKAK